jgi:hypothetical protein
MGANINLKSGKAADSLEDQNFKHLMIAIRPKHAVCKIRKIVLGVFNELCVHRSLFL